VTEVTTLLREHVDVRQIEGEPRRRWFLDDAIDLIVWFGVEDEIIGFQLCYDKHRDQRALTWHRDRGWRHDRVSDGEGRFGAPKQSPVLVADGMCDYVALAKLFGERCREIDDKISAFVLDKITELQRREG